MYSRVKDLSCWDSESVVIKGKVKNIKKFKTKKEKLGMSIIIKDFKGDEIQAIFWEDNFIKFQTYIRKYEIYEFRKFRIQCVRNKYFNQTQHEYEIIILPKTIIKKAEESFFVNVKDKELECVNIIEKKKCKRKRKFKEKKQFYNLKNEQQNITDFFEPVSKRRKIINEDVEQSVVIDEKQTNDKKNLNKHQPMITNYFKSL